MIMIYKSNDRLLIEMNMRSNFDNKAEGLTGSY